METKKDFYNSLNKNILEIKSTDSYIGSHKTNCIGTALYLVGEKFKDEHVEDETEIIFNKFVESANPEIGYLVGWINKRNKIYHAAVIVKTNPLLVANRDGIGVPFYSHEKFNEINSMHTESHENFKEIKYFIPSKLQKILEMEAQ